MRNAMGLRSVEQYLAGLRDNRVIFYGGEAVKDVTAHPALGIAAEHGATVFDYARQSPDLFTYDSEYGERCSA